MQLVHLLTLGVTTPPFLRILITGESGLFTAPWRAVGILCDLDSIYYYSACINMPHIAQAKSEASVIKERKRVGIEE